MYFDSLEGVPDRVIRELILKARSGNGKKFVIRDYNSYTRAYNINAAIPNPLDRAEVLQAGINGQPIYDMVSDFENLRKLSKDLANAESSRTVRIINKNIL